MSSPGRDLKWCRQVLLPSLRVIWAERPARVRRATGDAHTTHAPHGVPPFRIDGAGALEAWRAPSLPVDPDATRDPAPV